VLEGSAAAPAGLHEFLDFQCAACAKFAAETLPHLHRRYLESLKTLFAIRHLPLEAVHPEALFAARIAACAQTIGSFWSVHDAFLRTPLAMTRDDFRSRAMQAGVTATQLTVCADDDATTNRVQENVALAHRLGIQRTPTFLIGPIVDGQLKVVMIIVGAQPTARFEAALDAVLQDVAR
jgi:protein-disulfide isomerase